MDTPSEANTRFADFWSEVQSTNHVWVLRHDEGYAQRSSEEGVCFPIWSQRQMAERAAVHSLPGYQAEQVALDVFRDSVLPKLRDRGIWLGVNLTSGMGGIEIPCEQFEKEI